MSQAWRIDNDSCGVSRRGVQVWPAEDGSGVGAPATIRVEFEDEAPFELPREQARALGARSTASAPRRLLPGVFRFDPDSGEPLEPLPSPDPQGWTSLGSVDGTPATEAYVDIDPAESVRERLLFPAHSAYAVAGEPQALYAVHGELGLVRRWNADAADAKDDTAWLKAGLVGECYLPSYALRLAAGRHVLVTPTDAGPEALRTPALSGRQNSDVVLNARCVSGVAERMAESGPGSFMIPALVDGKLTLFSRVDDPGATWTSQVVQGIDGPPPGEVLAAPTMDSVGRAFWVGSTGVLIAPENRPPSWVHFEPGFTALRRTCPYKDGGQLWQLGRLHGPGGEGFAFRKLTPGPGQMKPVRNPHFSGGPLTYAAPDNVRRYRRPWEEPEPDDMLRMGSDRGFLAPLVTFQARADQTPKCLLMWVESPVATPFVVDEPAPPAPIGLLTHEPTRSISERIDGGVLQKVEALADVTAVIFRDRLYVLHRNHPHEFAPCVSWPVVRSR